MHAVADVAIAHGSHCISRNVYFSYIIYIRVYMYIL